MANSRYEYVKRFEQENFLLPDTYIVVRVDGKGFHKLSKHYNFRKPNDADALAVMNRAATSVMGQFSDVVMAYGDSDEYSFVLRRQCELYERREMKLNSVFASSFTANYINEWAKSALPALESRMLPMFDARCVVYPNLQVLQDYLRWRQVDCHINNLYNTAFWRLVESGLTNQEAENKLAGTLAKDKNEILFQLGINYNNEPEMFKKGTLLLREPRPDKRRGTQVNEYHIDIINDDFWAQKRFVLD